MRPDAPLSSGLTEKTRCEGAWFTQCGELSWRTLPKAGGAHPAGRSRAFGEAAGQPDVRAKPPPWAGQPRGITRLADHTAAAPTVKPLLLFQRRAYRACRGDAALCRPPAPGAGAIK